ncbi:synaptic vesicle glycoprotein 2A-like [Zerene cesonia]|uniref:synaptic vesicle glycoprotein 2A-like n=1 Tax=Zerene cesonia TaxID=33412 RepID=UPI0018E59D86|nr:synaptic vesicle glycoprotein 2A-like [Zerene cesonia]
MQEVNLALKECGFGRFHVKLLLSAYVGYTCGLAVSMNTPYILPIAECDLNMSLLQKGVLNAIPYVGMIVSSSVAGFLTDTFGRKRFIVYGFFGMFIFTVISGLSQRYYVLVTSKFFEGLLFAASFSPFLALTSELCHSGIRDRVMLVQSSFVAIAQISVALISWAILRYDWRDTLFDGYIVLNTWNYYLLIMSFWSLLASILYMFIPESPKYLITQHKYNEARSVLIQIYNENTGKPVESFKYANLWKDTMKQDIDETPEGEQKSQLSVGFENIKPLFKRPLLWYLLLFCFINFFTMTQYNVLRLWFPQLSTIVENYRQNGTEDLCVMLDTYTHDLRIKISNASVDDVCVPVRSGDETYLNTVILGCICLVPFIITSILVNRVGKKNLFLVCGLLSVGCTIGLRWSVSKIALVSLFSVGVSAAQTMLSLTQAMIVEQFPTSYRSLAMGLIMTAGRMGTLIGNITFPILLNLGCVVPFFTLAGLMLGNTTMALFLPTKKK